MRIIKFRFWSNHLKRFVIPDDDIFVGALKDPDMNPMQFTGLLDRSGKEIYEGDILRDTDEENSDYRATVIYVASKYDLNVSQYQLDDLNNGGYYLRDLEGIYGPVYTNVREVIGNIYENPELLEKGKE